jgi:hypothetical protein
LKHTSVPALAMPWPKQDPILRLWNFQLQRQRCSRLEHFYRKEKWFVL